VTGGASRRRSRCRPPRWRRPKTEAEDRGIAGVIYKPDTVDTDLGAARDRLTGEFKDSYTSLTHDVVIPDRSTSIFPRWPTYPPRRQCQRALTTQWYWCSSTRPSRSAMIRRPIPLPMCGSPFLISEQECILCGSNGVGRWRWVLSGGPARLVVVVGVAVSQNFRTVVVWCSAAFPAWPVVCPHASAVACGALPAVA